MSAPPTQRRPLGVAILAVLVGIYGILVILGGLLLVVGAAVGSLSGLVTLPAHFGGSSGALIGIIVFIIGLIILGVAVGLWNLRMWALVLALIVTFIELVIYGLAGAYLTLTFVLSLIVFVYLLAVSRHFS
jgi:hypothetical protein